MTRDVCEHFVPTDLPCDKCKQPTALRLADELRHVIKYSDSEHWDTLNEVVAELRCLHAEKERYDAECLKLARSWNDAERRCDALLEALKNIERSTYDSMTATLACAAIKAAEENT